MIGLGHRRGLLEISADVCWGDGTVEESLFADFVTVSDAALAQIVEEMPRLGGALTKAVRRGKPENDA